MNITQLVNQKYNYQNNCHSRLLSDDPSEGLIYTGYVLKNREEGSHHDITINEYAGLLIISGHGIYKDKDCELAINPGDFVQRLPGTTHSTIVTSDDWCELYLGIGAPVYNELLKLNVFTKDQPVIHPGVDFETVETFFHIHDRLEYMDAFQLPLIVPKAIEFLSRIHYLARHNDTVSEDITMLSTAALYIENHLRSRIAVEDVAAHVNMGYEKFRKAFTSHYHMSPGNYIIRRRIHLAQTLLSRDELSIKEIATTLGYPDNFAFSKQFKKITGRTPSDFRKMFIP